MKPSRHRSRLLAIPTCWLARFFFFCFSSKAGVLSQLQMLNSSIECLATDSSPLSSRLLCHFLLKVLSRCISIQSLFCALHSSIYVRSTIRIWFILTLLLPGKFIVHSRSTLIMMSPLYCRSTLIMMPLCTLAPLWSWNNPLLLKFDLLFSIVLSDPLSLTLWSFRHPFIFFSSVSVLWSSLIFLILWSFISRSFDFLFYLFSSFWISDLDPLIIFFLILLILLTWSSLILWFSSLYSFFDHVFVIFSLRSSDPLILISFDLLILLSWSFSLLKSF